MPRPPTHAIFGLKEIAVTDLGGSVDDYETGGIGIMNIMLVYE